MDKRIDSAHYYRKWIWFRLVVSTSSLVGFGFVFVNRVCDKGLEFKIEIVAIKK